MTNGKNKQKKKQQQAAQNRNRAQEQQERDKADHKFLDEHLRAQNKDIEQKKASAQAIRDEELPRFKNMPKVELHAHLSGSLSKETIQLIINNDPQKGKEVMAKYKLEKPEDMKRVFDCFPAVHEILHTPEAIKIAVYETVREFAEDGCVYLELRTAPKNTPFMTFEKYLRVCIETIETARADFPQMKVFLIVSLDRAMTFDVAASVLQLTGVLQLETNVIVGIELSGKPNIDGLHLIHLFHVARRFHGLGITVHLAETKDHMNEVLEYLMLQPDRIGHGTFLHTNAKFVELVKYYKIPIEICLSSNTWSKSTETILDSHFAFWRSNGVPVSINTDDKGVIPGATLTEEYYKASVAFNLTVRDMIEINKDALKASFAYKYNATDLTDTWRKIEANTLE